jgi:flavin-dependent dehydrogenase
MRRAGRRAIDGRWAAGLEKRPGGPTLEDGARVAVLGGGPAGSFFGYFLKRMAATIDLEVEIEIFEPRFFSQCGPAGCNHCGGIVSESLVQLLATEGINLPPRVVQRGVDSYVIHMDVGSVRIDTPLQEKRIAALYRGNGPRTSEPSVVGGFDLFLQELAVEKGVRIRRQLVERIDWSSGRPAVVSPDGSRETYDLVAVAAGVNSRLLETLVADLPGVRFPGTTKAYICEFRLGAEEVERCLGTSMHVFLLDLPRLEFAALIPKGEFITVCLLGDDVDDELVGSFLATEEVRSCFPDGVVPEHVCHCFPLLNVRAADPPFAERIVFIGDSGVARLYKDGIGSAYRTAKAAARTAAFRGISAADFRAHFLPACKAIDFDNTLGRLVFASSSLIQRWRFTRRAVLRMTEREQRTGGTRWMSGVLWDVFTGSAPYRDVFFRSMHPAFVGSLLWNVIAAARPTPHAWSAAERRTP